MDKLDDVWTERDYPVLREAVRLIDEGRYAPGEAIAQATGLSEDLVERSLAALERRGFLQTEGALSGLPDVTDVAGAAYLITGLHPDGEDALSRLIEGLQQAAEQAGDENERSRLRRAAEALGAVTRDVAAGVITAVLTTAVK